MTRFIYSLAIASFLSINLVHAQDQDVIRLNGGEKNIAVEVAGNETLENHQQKDQQEADKASLKLIDELTERLYLQRKKRWQKAEPATGALTAN